MNLLLQAIKKRIKHREEHLRNLKRLYRDPDHQPPKLETHAELRFQKTEATLDYVIVAASRGKVHRHSDNFDSQLEFIEKNVKGELTLRELPQLLEYGQYVYDTKKAGEELLTWHRWDALNGLTSGEHGTGLLEQI